jgi:hypothetical protein
MPNLKLKPWGKTKVFLWLAWWLELKINWKNLAGTVEVIQQG